MVYVIQVCWYIPLLCVHWKTPDDGQRNCPKHVEFYSRNKFEKLMHLVGFIIRMKLHSYTFWPEFWSPAGQTFWGEFNWICEFANGIYWISERKSCFPFPFTIHLWPVTFLTLKEPFTKLHDYQKTPHHKKVKIRYCILCVLDRASSWYLNKGWPTRWHLLYYVNLLLNMFRMLIHPSSGACDYLVRYCVGCIVVTWGVTQ